MPTVDEIMAAIAKLTQAERDEVWRRLNPSAHDLGEVDADGNDVWDRQIISDAKAGKLDHLIARADADFAAGRHSRIHVVGKAETTR